MPSYALLKIEQLKEELAHLEQQKTSRSLRGRRRDLAEELAGLQRSYYSTSSSHFQHLLPELLLEIFQWAVLGEWVSRGPAQASRKAPVNVSCVCKAWRQVTLARTQLWGFIRLEISSCDGHEVKRAIRSLQTRLQRSGSSPLTVDITFVFYNNESNLEGIALDAFAKLLENSARWKNVRLDLWALDFNPFRSAMEVMLGETPYLEELQVSCSFGGWAYQTTSEPCPLMGQLDLSRSPRLQKLKVRNVNFRFLSDGASLRHLVHA